MFFSFEISDPPRDAANRLDATAAAAIAALPPQRRDHSCDDAMTPPAPGRSA
jgi:hypothetical protein